MNFNTSDNAIAVDQEHSGQMEFMLQTNALGTWSSGDFDLFPAGAGQISALIDEIKPIKEIIEKIVS